MRERKPSEVELPVITKRLEPDVGMANVPTNPVVLYSSIKKGVPAEDKAAVPLPTRVTTILPAVKLP